MGRLIGGKRREKKAGLGDACPGWLLEFFLTGEGPERESPDHHDFVMLRYFNGGAPGPWGPRDPAMHEAWKKHRALVLAEAKRRKIEDVYGRHFEAA